jgi:hypothetical protein
MNVHTKEVRIDGLDRPAIRSRFGRAECEGGG